MAAIVGALTGWRILRLVLRVLALFVAAVVVYFAVTAVQIWLTAQRSDPHQAQAIVVMGAAQYNGTPSPDLKSRLDQAYALWQRHLAPVVVVTGSNQPGDQYTEASTGARYLEQRSPPVPASSICQVGGSDSWANLSDAAAALKGQGRSDVLVVTDGFHEKRSLSIAAAVGLDASPVPASHSPIAGWSAVPYYLKETVAVAAGRIIGFNHLELLHRSGGAAVPPSACPG